MAILVSLLTRGLFFHSPPFPGHFLSISTPELANTQNQSSRDRIKGFHKPCLHNPSLSLTPVPSQFGGGRVRLADSHALFLVDVETVILDAEIVLQVGLGADEFLQGGLGGAQAVLQHVDGLVDFADLSGKSVG